jgi:CSLREA domain-containing protein
MDVGGRPNRGFPLRGATFARRSTQVVVAGALIATSLLTIAVSRHVSAVGTTFTVNSTGDAPDASSSDGVCATAGNVCTLRAAISQANARTGHDTIVFAIPGSGPHRLTPASNYPIVNDPAGVTIDGYTQPGARVNTATHGSNAVIKIELQGTGPAGIDGLYFQSPYNVVRGLAVFDFGRHIRFWGGSLGLAHHNEVIGNFIGTNASGTFGQGVRTLNSSGVQIERNSYANRIGKPGLENRNVISGAGDRGVAIFNADSDGNLIQNNVIGLSPSGARLRNWGHGVDINYSAADNVVGGLGAGEANVVSGNTLSGVEISHDTGTTGNRVIGNLIGTSLDGSSGSTTYRNEEFGVNLEGNGSCPTTCPPDINNNVVEGNTIVGSKAGVMIWKGAHDNVVRNNTIGLLPNGSVAPSSSNTIWGVLIETGAFDNLIDSNVIAGVQDGIQVRPDNDFTQYSGSNNPDFPTYGNTFRRNSIWGITNGFGIDIAPISNVNDTASELDPDIQGAIRGPDIVSANEDQVTVSTCPGCRVELFTTEAVLPQPWGQGRVFVRDALANGSGIAVFAFRTTTADPLVLLRNDRVAATTTDGAGNTSEFSLRVTVAAGTLGPPTNPTTTTSTTTTATTTTTTTTIPPTTTTATSGSAEMPARDAHIPAKRCGTTC